MASSRCKDINNSEFSQTGSILLEINNGFNFDGSFPIDSQNVNPQILEVLNAHHRLQEITGVTNVEDFCRAVKEKRATEIINVAEVIQARRMAQIADDIASRPDVHVVLIAGPSSSGKTTTSKRLSIQLMAAGRKPVALSLDDYFVNRVDTPLDENGEYDFESLYAVDIDFFNEQLNALLRGEEVELARYNFETGRREFRGEKLQITPHTVLILEGIHALNPKLTESIPEASKYRIFASAITSIILDGNNYMPTPDIRLLRRILRDHKYRNFSAEETILRWPSVRKGEDTWIFPFFSQADAFFNTSLIYELAALKERIEPLLSSVPSQSEAYTKAQELLRDLRYFPSVPDKSIPPTSLLREFMGGSSFHY
ncbi:MAG: hypothetical protein J5814_05910 [Bacteroidaceae bacterium]|nr:hypothetical protein [Bacteroidaceae bacterium]